MNKNTFKRIQRSLFSRPEFGVFLGLIVLFIVFLSTSDIFLTSRNLLNILRQVSFIGILSMGMTMVMTNGDIDLSIGGIYYISAAFTAYSMVNGIPIWISIIIGLALGLFSGFLNGVLCAYVGLPSFIATLGVMSVIRGIALLVTDGFTITLNSSTVNDPSFEVFRYMASGKVFGVIPMLAIIFVVVVAISYVVYHKTILSVRFKAVGSNRDAAVAAGINTRSVRITAFVINGFLAAMGGILMASFLNNVQANIGAGLELSVIAPCIIGGVSIAGGKGSIIGTVIGVLILGVLNNGLILLGVSPFWQVLLVGVIIIGSVSLDIVTKRQSL